MTLAFIHIPTILPLATLVLAGLAFSIAVVRCFKFPREFLLSHLPYFAVGLGGAFYGASGLTMFVAAFGFWLTLIIGIASFGAGLLAAFLLWHTFAFFDTIGLGDLLEDFFGELKDRINKHMAA